MLYFDFTPFEWGMFGFALLLMALGIYYVVEDERRKRETKD